MSAEPQSAPAPRPVPAPAPTRATAAGPGGPVDTRATVASITSAVAGGRSLPSVAAEFGFGLQALRELLARNTPVDTSGATG